MIKEHSTIARDALQANLVSSVNIFCLLFFRRQEGLQLIAIFKRKFLISKTGRNKQSQLMPLHWCSRIVCKPYPYYSPKSAVSRDSNHGNLTCISAWMLVVISVLATWDMTRSSADLTSLEELRSFIEGEGGRNLQQRPQKSIFQLAGDTTHDALIFYALG